MPNSNGAVDLSALSSEEQEAITRLAEDHPEVEDPAARRPVIAAVVVALNKQGEVEVHTLSEAERIVPDVPQPTGDLLYGMVAAVQKDVQASATANHTIQLQQQLVQQMMQAQQAQQIAAQVAQNPFGEPR